MYPQGMSRIPPFPSLPLLLLIPSHQPLPILSLGPAAVLKAAAEVIVLECLPRQVTPLPNPSSGLHPPYVQACSGWRALLDRLRLPTGASPELLTLSLLPPC